jgi:hypothetical protein
MCNPNITDQESRLQPDQALPAVYCGPDRHPTGERTLNVSSSYRRSGVPASAGSGVASSLPVSRQASDRLKPGLPVISYPDYFSTFISRDSSELYIQAISQNP